MTATHRYVAYANEDPNDPPGTLKAPVVALDAASGTLDTPRDAELEWSGGLGRGVSERRGGFYQPSGNTVQGVDLDTVGRFLRWTLGLYGYSAGAPNRHEVWASEEQELPRFSTYVGKDILGGGDFEHAFAGCAVNSLDLAVDSGYMILTADLLSIKDSRGTIRDLTTIKGLLPTKRLRAFADATLNVGGTDESCAVRRWRLTVANNLDGPAGQGMGSRFACRVPAGDRRVTFEMELWYNSLDHVQRLWGDTNGPSDSGATDFPLTISIAGDVAGESITFLMESCHLKAAPVQFSGRTRITQAVTGQALVVPHTKNDATTVQSEMLATVLSDAGDLSTIV